jgi:ParB family chromosome partitioning protein
MSPLKVTGRFDEEGDNDFAKYFGMVDKKSNGELVPLLATWLSKSIDFRHEHASSMPLSGEHAEAEEAMVINRIDGKDLNAALRKAFDAKDYFESVPKQLCIDALAEAAPKVPMNKSAPKAEIAKLAIANVPKTGWLPRELRTSHYDGPGAEKPARKKKAA